MKIFQLKVTLVWFLNSHCWHFHWKHEHKKIPQKCRLRRRSRILMSSWNNSSYVAFFGGNVFSVGDVFGLWEWTVSTERAGGSVHGPCPQILPASYWGFRRGRCPQSLSLLITALILHSIDKLPNIRARLTSRFTCIQCCSLLNNQNMF